MWHKRMEKFPQLHFTGTGANGFDPKMKIKYKIKLKASLRSQNKAPFSNSYFKKWTQSSRLLTSNFLFSNFFSVSLLFSFWHYRKFLYFDLLILPFRASKIFECMGIHGDLFISSKSTLDGCIIAFAFRTSFQKLLLFTHHLSVQDPVLHLKTLRPLRCMRW